MNRVAAAGTPLVLLGVATSAACQQGAAPAGPPGSEPDPIPPMIAAEPGRYDQPVDVLHYGVTIGLSDEADWIAGSAMLDLRVTAPFVEPLRLDFTGLLVDRVVSGDEVLAFEQRDGFLDVTLPPGADSLALEVSYRGTPDDGLILRENVHGVRTAFVDNWPNRARFWFPSVDHPSDKATATLTVIAPRSWNVVANGEAVERGVPLGSDHPTFGPASTGGKARWRWEADVPISTYNVVFGGGPMVVDTVGLAACGRAPASHRPDGCVAVSTWLFPESRERGARSFRRAAEMVDYFTGTFGPFPYQKLANVQSSTRFGGMENASAIFYSEQAIASGADIEGTVSHEIAHQWFGDAVTEASWHHLWLSEGFATYFGAQFFEFADGVEVFRERMESSRRDYVASDVVNRPVLDDTQDRLIELLNENNYEKGAWVLHMLRGIVGDPAFFDGVRTYYERYRNGVALTDDFRSVMESASGQELGWFFDQWLRRPGHPVLEIEDAYGEGVLTVTVRQLQDPEWPTFRLPMQVEVETPSGVVRRSIEVTEREQTFTLSVDGPPRGLRLDPDGWVLKVVAGENRPR